MTKKNEFGMKGWAYEVSTPEYSVYCFVRDISHDDIECDVLSFLKARNVLETDKDYEIAKIYELSPIEILSIKCGWFDCLSGVYEKAPIAWYELGLLDDFLRKHSLLSICEDFS